MKKVYLSSLLILLAVSASKALDVGGSILSDTTWSNTSEPYDITSPIQITYGSTLTIGAGVTVNDGDIEVFGNLSVTGTQQSKVAFNNVKISSEGTLAENASISIRHAAIRGGSLYDPTHYGTLLLQDSYLVDLPFIHIYYPESDVNISRNIFENFGGISAGCQDVTVLIENNHFKSFVRPYVGWGMVTSWATYGNAQIVVRYNSFGDFQGDPAVALEAGYDPASMNAQSNYWGTTTESEIQAMIYDKNDDLSCAGYIDYLPYLTEHHADTPILGAEINVAMPSNTALDNNGSPIKIVSPLSVNSESVNFTVSNIGNDILSGLSLTKSGSGASYFQISTLTSSTLPAGDSLAFTVTFTPSFAGTVTAQLSISSNDTDDNPFLINLTGQGLSTLDDTDGDELNDVAEFQMSDLGFDWQVSQANLVNTLYSNSGSAGLYTESQIKVIHADVTFLNYDPDTELFTLTMGVKISPNLTDEFQSFPLSEGQISTNALGEIDIKFTSPDDSAFFRLESN